MDFGIVNLPSFLFDFPDHWIDKEDHDHNREDLAPNGNGQNDIGRSFIHVDRQTDKDVEKLERQAVKQTNEDDLEDHWRVSEGDEVAIDHQEVTDPCPNAQKNRKADLKLNEKEKKLVSWNQRPKKENQIEISPFVLEENALEEHHDRPDSHANDGLLFLKEIFLLFLLLFAFHNRLADRKDH